MKNLKSDLRKCVSDCSDNLRFIKYLFIYQQLY